jgi:hypothetical protein
MRAARNARSPGRPLRGPGVAERTAQVEVNRDRHRHEPLPDRWPSGLLGRRCPGNQPVRRQTPLRTPPERSKWLTIALTEAALAATRTKGSYLQAQYQRVRPLIAHGSALGAVQHSTLIAYWHMFTTGETYRDLGGDHCGRRDPERQTRRFVAQLERLGDHVSLEPSAA